MLSVGSVRLRCDDCFGRCLAHWLVRASVAGPAPGRGGASGRATRSRSCADACSKPLLPPRSQLLPRSGATWWVPVRSGMLRRPLMTTGWRVPRRTPGRRPGRWPGRVAASWRGWAGRCSSCSATMATGMCSRWCSICTRRLVRRRSPGPAWCLARSRTGMSTPPSAWRGRWRAVRRRGGQQATPRPGVCRRYQPCMASMAWRVPGWMIGCGRPSRAPAASASRCLSRCVPRWSGCSARTSRGCGCTQTHRPTSSTACWGRGPSPPGKRSSSGAGSIVPGP